MSGARWYAIPRSYRVEDVMYVRAASASAARRSAEEYEYEEATDPCRRATQVVL
jgi:hypothetical protein